ncbi:MAG: hypothetical protein IT380_03590, partial [Myxococcales bacterium]|nr:hypothetical protein [Myxococcales bacterium]
PAVLAKAVEQHPTDARLLLAAAEVALQDGRAEDAEAFASRGFALAPWSLRLAALRTWSAAATGRCDEATRRLGIAQGLLPERPSQKVTDGFRELMGLLKQCQEAAAGATSAGRTHTGAQLRQREACGLQLRPRGGVTRAVHVRLRQPMSHSPR